MNKVVKGLLSLSLIGLTYFLAYIPQQADFYQIIGAYLPFFVLYGWMCLKINDSKDIKFFLFLGILLRAVVLFAVPNLSDDVYRFVWDGRLIMHGYNPFLHLPSYFVDNNIYLYDPNHELYELLNSPNYYTVYPPVNQAIFAFATNLARDNLYANILFLKLPIFLAEIGSIWLIYKLLQELNLPSQRTLWYALNPLLIIETCGNVHFEGVMIFFLLLSIYGLVKSERTESIGTKNTLFILSAVCFALSVATKLLPLMFLPFYIKKLKIKSIAYFAIIGVSLLLMFLPMLNQTFLSNFGDSLDLYFRFFEFNGSIYYLFRWLRIQYKGYNLIAQIGPALSLCVLVLILLQTLIAKTQKWEVLFRSMLFALSVYLLFRTTVHPWHIAMTIPICLFTNYRFPILWSGLIFLTYINYSYPTYYENLWIVAVEYILLFGFIFYEWRVGISKS